MPKINPEESYKSVKDDDYLRDRNRFTRMMRELTPEQRTRIVFYVDGQPCSLNVIYIEVKMKTRLSKKLLLPVMEFIEVCENA